MPHGAQVSHEPKTGAIRWGGLFGIILSSSLVLGCADRGPSTGAAVPGRVGDGQRSAGLAGLDGLIGLAGLNGLDGSRDRPGKTGAAGVKSGWPEEGAVDAEDVEALGCGPMGTPFGLPLEVSIRAVGGEQREAVNKGQIGRRVSESAEAARLSEAWSIELRPRAGGERWLEEVGPEVVIEVHPGRAEGVRRERLVRAGTGFAYRWRPASPDERVVLMWTEPDGGAGLRVEYEIPGRTEPAPRGDILIFEKVETRGRIEEDIAISEREGLMGLSGSHLQGVRPSEVDSAGPPPGERNE